MRLWILAWRSIWRQRRRTWLTTSAIGLGLAGMLVYEGLIIGMEGQMLDAATNGWTGHAQVHHPEYRRTRELIHALHGTSSLLEEIDGLPSVKAATARLLASGLLTIGDRVQGVQVVGIDLDREARVTGWKDQVIEGQWPGGGDQALVGHHLAKRLEIGLGSRVVLTLTHPETGDLARTLVTIEGILGTSNATLDRRAIVLPIDTLAKVLGTKDVAHEISISLAISAKEKDAIAAAIAPLKKPDRAVATWQEINPALAQILDLQYTYLMFTMVIVFLIISLGIINTISMSFMERRREFGVLGAIGTGPARMAKMVFAESACLGLVGVLLGCVAGAIFNWPLATYGMDLHGAEFAGVAFNKSITSTYDPMGWALVALAFFLMTAMTGVFTAWRAARLEPVEAMRAE